jgi:hypothetical protein
MLSLAETARSAVGLPRGSTLKAAAALGAIVYVSANWEAVVEDLRLALRFAREGVWPVLSPSATLGTQNLTLKERLRALPELRFMVFRIERNHQKDCRLMTKLGNWHEVFKHHALAHVKTAQALKHAKPKTRNPMESGPVVKDLVLIGGGHSHAFILRMIGMEPEEGVRVTLITRDMETPYSGMLPGHIAGLYTRAECHIDLNRLARFAKVRLVHAPCIGIDREKKHVLLSGRPPISYDVLSINIGSAPSIASMPKIGGAVPVKPIDSFGRRWDEILDRVPSPAPESESAAVLRPTNYPFAPWTARSKIS